MPTVPWAEVLFEHLHFAASRVRHSRWFKDQRWIWAALQPPVQQWIDRRYARQGILTWVNDVEPPLWLDRSVGSAYGPNGPCWRERDAYRAFIAALTPTSCVIDVGASFGLYTLGACTHATAGRVIAFEPAPPASDLLERHVGLNNATSRVECLRMAVGDREGACTLHVPPSHSMSSVARSNTVWTGEWADADVAPFEVPMTTLDAFCGRRGIAPDVIKIDVEGAEVMVLKGARETLSRYRPLVFCEVHPVELRAVGHSVEEFDALMSEAGYDATRISPTRSTGIFNVRLTPRQRA